MEIPSGHRRTGACALPLGALLLAAASLAACNRHGGVPRGTLTDPAPGAAGTGKPITTEPYTLDWLVRNSPFVFVGRLSARTVETDSRKLVITRNRFDVETALIGSSPQKVVTLTTFGGTLGNETVSVSDTPEFVEGQTYVVFTDLARTTYNPVTGDNLGVFLVANSEVYTYGGQAVATVQEGRFRLGSAVLEEYPGPGSREPVRTEAGNPTVGGAVKSARRTVVDSARPMQLAEFTRLIQAARR